MSDIDTGNPLLVGMRGDDIIVMAKGVKLSRTEALNMAAWIVALADRGDFDPLLEAIKGT